MRVLCVAEKPSIARSITDILSGGRYDTNRLGRTQSFSFDYPQTNASFTVTYVAGHITELDFPETHRKWHSCDPFTLFDAPIEVKHPERVRELVRNIEMNARNADMLMIWTDCDREGEHIGSEIVQVARKVNARIRVSRARFSAIIPDQIHRAAQHPVNLDNAQADAVFARQVLDLRLGAAFTRMQCLALQNRFGNLLEKKLISYGPCQFPTLGFVVSRYEQVKAFAPETFNYIFLSLERPAEDGRGGIKETVFKWKRGHIFDFDIALMLYEMVLESPMAKVTKVLKKNTKKWKPYPLTTVDLQKSGSRLLKMAPKMILDTADALYQRGILSYPRTETDQFDDQFDFQTYISKQTSSPEWGAFATRVKDGAFSKPRKGKKNDKAHPPIHPTAYAGNLAGNEKKVYEYVTRRFLASCSKDAEGFQTTITILVNGEEFYATGLLVLERNYLEVFPYDSWSSHELPNFEEGQEFMPSVCEFREGETTKPSLLTDADLVGLMDKNGIGTDATIAQHIQTIVDREYVMERFEGKTKYLVPSTLGVGLVHGYNQIGFEKSLSKPQLRRETEQNMVQICDRVKSKDDMLRENIDKYKEVFLLARGGFETVVQSVRHYVQGDGHPEEDNNADRGGARPPAARGRGPGNGGNDSDDDSDNGPPPPAGAAARARAAAPPAANRTVVVNPNAMNCHCGVPAVERVSGKESTKGRRFWRCGGSKDCEFFQWVDTPPNRPVNSNLGNGATFGVSRHGSAAQAGENGSGSVVPAKRKYPEDKDEPARECWCKLSATRLTVTKEGDNKGRVFWKCPNPEDSKCKFFEWDDTPPGSSTAPATGIQFGGSTRQNSSQAGGSGTAGGTSGECYKCHQVGHWASSCPNGNAVASTSGARAGGGGGAGKSDDECYKCGKKGHWASACPNPESKYAPNKRLRTDDDFGGSFGGGGKFGGGDKFNSGKGGGRSRSGSDAGGNACFKCGQPGHYASNCTGAALSSGSRGRGRGRGSGRSVSSSRGRGKGSKGRGGKKSSFSAADDDY